MLNQMLECIREPLEMGAADTGSKRQAFINEKLPITSPWIAGLHYQPSPTRLVQTQQTKCWFNVRFANIDKFIAITIFHPEQTKVTHFQFFNFKTSACHAIQILIMHWTFLSWCVIVNRAFAFSLTEIIWQVKYQSCLVIGLGYQSNWWFDIVPEWYPVKGTGHSF